MTSPAPSRAFSTGECADLLNEQVTHRIEMSRRDIKVIQTLSLQHIERLFAACERSETPEYVAHERILVILLDMGIRANELCTLTVDCAVFSPDEAYAIVTGKGRKQCERGLLPKQ